MDEILKEFEAERNAKNGGEVYLNLVLKLTEPVKI